MRRPFDPARWEIRLATLRKAVKDDIALVTHELGKVKREWRKARALVAMTELRKERLEKRLETLRDRLATDDL